MSEAVMEQEATKSYLDMSDEEIAGLSNPEAVTVAEPVAEEPVLSTVLSTYTSTVNE